MDRHPRARMSHRRGGIWTLLAGMALLVLAGCGGGPAPVATTPTDPPTTMAGAASTIRPATKGPQRIIVVVGESLDTVIDARERLGARPLVALFKRVCNKPLAEPETIPEAFLFGLRLMAIDGTVLDLPDTPENVRVFGRRRTPRASAVCSPARRCRSGCGRRPAPGIPTA